MSVCSIFTGSSNTGNCNIKLYKEYKTGKCHHQFNYNPDVYVGRMLVGSKYDARSNAEHSKCGTDHMGNEGGRFCSERQRKLRNMFSGAIWFFSRILWIEFNRTKTIECCRASTIVLALQEDHYEVCNNYEFSNER